jgi:predicted homoserine dehydrogenase-like protein
MVRGLIDPSEDFARDGLVPLGVLSGAVLKRDVPTDHTLTYDDVELDERSVIVRIAPDPGGHRRGQARPDASPSSGATLAG